MVEYEESEFQLSGPLEHHQSEKEYESLINRFLFSNIAGREHGNPSKIRIAMFNE